MQEIQEQIQVIQITGQLQETITAVRIITAAVTQIQEAEIQALQTAEHVQTLTTEVQVQGQAPETEIQVLQTVEVARVITAAVQVQGQVPAADHQAAVTAAVQAVQVQEILRAQVHHQVHLVPAEDRIV